MSQQSATDPANLPPSAAAPDAVTHPELSVSDRTTSELERAQARILYLESNLKETYEQLEAARSHIAWMETSKFWRLRLRAIALKSRWAGVRWPWAAFNPVQELRLLKRRWRAERLGIPASDDPHYQAWLNRYYPSKVRLRELATQIPTWSYQPTISIIMPVFNCPEPFLRQAIASVTRQIYPHWELCIADDASTAPWVRPILEKAAQQDSRIKVHFRPENGHISASSNSAIALATGEYIALFDHDDLLAPHALFSVVALLNQHPDADMIYTDEDKIDETNLHKGHYFKPDWSPDALMSRMYTCHFGVYRRSLINAIGGFRLGYEGSQDHDLVLRFTEKTDRIYHIADMLYHWRIHAQSAASGATAKPYAYIAAKKSLADALERRGEPGAVMDVPGYPGLYAVRYEIQQHDRVSIIIPTRDQAALVDQCLASIWGKTSYPNYEIIIVDNGSTELSLTHILSLWQDKFGDRLRVLRLDIPFNFSALNNQAVQQAATGKYLLFLNNDTQVMNPDWLEGLVEQAQRQSIGAVGAKLFYADNTIQHAGVVLGVGGIANHGHRGFPAGAHGYNSHLIAVNNYAAVTGACLMCRREVFEAVGGFDEALSVAFNDIDLCLKFRQAGYYTVYVPHVQLYHYESKSRGLETTPEKQARLQQEAALMQDRWGSWIQRDPFYNPHLTRHSLDYSLNLSE